MQVAFGWWMSVDSIVPTVVNTPVRGEVAWITLALTVAGLMVAGIRIMVARRGEPVLDAVKGLVTVAMVSAVGLWVVQTLVRAGDRWSAQLMADGVDGVGDEIATALMLSNAQPGLVLLLGVIVFVLSLGQAAMMLFREGAILMLTGMLPLAAAGQMVGFGRQWLPKVTGWLLALVLYKPVAALTYFAVFRGLDVAESGREVLVAVVMLGMSVVALPAMMKLFSWTSGSAGGSSGGSGVGVGCRGRGDDGGGVPADVVRCGAGVARGDPGGCDQPVVGSGRRLGGGPDRCGDDGDVGRRVAVCRRGRRRGTGGSCGGGRGHQGGPGGT